MAVLNNQLVVVGGKSAQTGKETNLLGVHVEWRMDLAFTPNDYSMLLTCCSYTQQQVVGGGRRWIRW